jgi:hypothetical protein
LRDLKDVNNKIDQLIKKNGFDRFSSFLKKWVLNSIEGSIASLLTSAIISFRFGIYTSLAYLGFSIITYLVIIIIIVALVISIKNLNQLRDLQNQILSFKSSFIMND